MKSDLKLKRMSAADLPVLLYNLSLGEYLYETSTGIYGVKDVGEDLKKIQDRSMERLTLGVLFKNDVEVTAFTDNVITDVGFLLLQQAMITNRLYLGLTKTKVGTFVTFYHL